MNRLFQWVYVVTGFATENHYVIIKFIVAGSLAALVDITSLHILIDFFHIWYVIATPLAYLTALSVSFFMQKYWTFEHKDSKATLWQAPVFFMIQFTNMILNTVGVVLFVEYGDFNPIIAQIVVGLILAISSFFIYRNVFTK